MLKGSTEPRIYTEPLRELTPETSLGFEMIDFSRDVLEFDLLPWQKWLLIHAFEIIGDFDTGWSFRYRKVVSIVARQNGKTTLSVVISAFFLYALQVGLIIGTAQDLEQAEDTWEELVEMVSADPELASHIKHIWRTNGSKRLQLTGNRDYRVKASTRKAGRGKSADLVFLDELREHQTWDAYSAISKTGIAKANALLWAMSNAGDGASIVLRHFRIQGHIQAGDPDGLAAALASSEPVNEDDGGTLGFFEWSAPPKADKHDKEAWAAANPSLGYTITERALASDCATDPDEVFKTECLCQWVSAAITSPFPNDSWEMGRDEKSEIAPDSPLVFGVDMSADRGRTSIAVCGYRSDGNLHIELVAYRPGVGWIRQWFAKRAAKQHMTIALQGRGAPISSVKDILETIENCEVSECVGPDVTGWAGRLWDSVSACDPDSTSDAVPVFHRSQPALDLAAAVAATKPLGDGAWAWDRRKSTEDVSPLIAATMALGSLTQPIKRESAYEDIDGLIFL